MNKVLLLLNYNWLYSEQRYILIGMYYCSMFQRAQFSLALLGQCLYVQYRHRLLCTSLLLDQIHHTGWITDTRIDSFHVLI